MSAVAVVTPIVIANWPLITAAVTAAVASLGFTAAGGGRHRPGQATGRATAPRSSSKTVPSSRAPRWASRSSSSGPTASGRRSAGTPAGR